MLMLLGVLLGSCSEVTAPIVLEHDLGTAPVGSTIVQDVEVLNHTMHAWSLGDIRTTCDCVSGELLVSVVAPGDRAILRVKVRMSQEGMHKHDLYAAMVYRHSGRVAAQDIVVRLYAQAYGPPWTAPSSRLISTPSQPDRFQIDFSIPVSPSGKPCLAAVAIQQGNIFGIGGMLPGLDVSLQEPVVRSGRVIWKAHVSVPAMPGSFEGLTHIRASIPDLGIDFPEVQVRWVPAPSEDVWLIMKEHSSIEMEHEGGCAEDAIAEGERACAADDLRDGVSDHEVVVQPVTNGVRLTTGEGLGVGTVRLHRGGSARLVKVLVVP
ncbi:MAG: hypothetical protein KF830_12535 [Planctomycetes bacterium]|nr:hypothetical protein [Planctomycetota bacterium]